jgi:ribulose-phosphate 3-epimerase
MRNTPIVLPSILSADFGRLEESVRLLRDAGCELFHVDVMDGRFVPNLTFGPKLVRDLGASTGVRFDVHLMVEEPEALVPMYDAPSVEYLTIHPEATVHLQRALAQIRDMGKKAGAALNPATPLSHIEHVLPDLDLLLIMTVNPGFSGQEFIPQLEEKIAAAAKLRRGHGFVIEVDGGINPETVSDVVAAGGEYLVAGSAVYGQKDPAAAYADMEARARKATSLP